MASGRNAAKLKEARMSSPNRTRIAIWGAIGLGFALYLFRLHSHAIGNTQFEVALSAAVLAILVLPLILWFGYLKSEGLFESAAFALMSGISSFTSWKEKSVAWGATFAAITFLFLMTLVWKGLVLSKRRKEADALREGSH